MKFMLKVAMAIGAAQAQGDGVDQLKVCMSGEHKLTPFMLPDTSHDDMVGIPPYFMKPDTKLSAYSYNYQLATDIPNYKHVVPMDDRWQIRHTRLAHCGKAAGHSEDVFKETIFVARSSKIMEKVCTLLIAHLF